jgi:hypothetical protein
MGWEPMENFKTYHYLSEVKFCSKTTVVSILSSNINPLLLYPVYEWCMNILQLILYLIMFTRVFAGGMQRAASSLLRPSFAPSFSIAPSKFLHLYLSAYQVRPPPCSRACRRFLRTCTCKTCCPSWRSVNSSCRPRAR